jgi:uncharacterized membrane protein YciS (DUF1049 family)
MTTNVEMGEGLDAVLHQLKTQDSRIGIIETKFDVFGNKLSEITSALNLLSAKPNFDIQKAIALCVQIGILFSMVCTGIIWLSVQLNSSDMTALKAQDARIIERLTEMNTRLLRAENQAPIPLQ